MAVKKKKNCKNASHFLSSKQCLKTLCLILKIWHCFTITLEIKTYWKKWFLMAL